YAGTAFIDTVSITKANVKVLEDGDKWLIYNRKKTGTLARVKLLPEALELMAKYEDEARDTLFPLLSPNRVRIDLITICKLAETSKTYSYHVSRHTFATMELTMGADLYTTSKLLGHTEVRTTQIYAKIINKKKDEAVSLLDSAFEE
ncbi:site-specific integrase, partial [Segatella copri]